MSSLGADATPVRVSSPFVLTFGVVLPVITLVVELATRTCADAFFDPMPTPWHALLVAVVPVANFVVWRATAFGAPERRRSRRFLGWLNGVATGLSLCYALLFLPLTPIALVAIVAFGIGFLPLSPLFSLAAALVCRAYLREYARDGRPVRVPNFWTGLGSAALLLTLASAQGLLTDLGVQMSRSHSPDTQRRGIALLRAVGSEDRLLRIHRGESRGGGSWFTTRLWETRPGDRSLRGIYYRVTGNSIDDTDKPDPAEGRTFEFARGSDSGGRTSAFDDGRGGTRVGQHRAGLFLEGSRIDGTIDADAALAYLEWTFVFRNDTAWQEEARTQVALPTGGVVSRLTLWIDGEPREAAFGRRAQVRGAYESVVRERRDPVLVTTAGPDRVLVQCFPVPPKGRMKVRLGITAPLQLASLDRGALLLPSLPDANFITEAKHAVWIEGRRTLSDASGVLKSHGADAGHVLRGDLPAGQLTVSPPSIGASRSADATISWTRDPLQGSERLVVQRIRENASPLKRLVLVIDGSRRMRTHVRQIADALGSLPSGLELAVLVASDDVIDLGDGTRPATAATIRSLQEGLRRVRFKGGADNVPALTRAWDLAAESTESVILWLHAPQPELLGVVDPLLQRWERSPGKPRLLSVQLAPGSDRVLEALDGVREVTQPIPPQSAIPNLASLVASLTTSRRIEITREKVDELPTDEAAAHETSDHLARLWAHDRSLDLTRSTKPGGHDRAAALASSYQLVTPITGAVVLETAQQYQVAGLKPVDPESVPTVPEPGTASLLACAASLLLRRPRRASRR